MNRLIFLVGIFLCLSPRTSYAQDKNASGSEQNSETQPQNESGKDTLGWEPFREIEVDLTNNRFSNQYLPFDVPFVLTGTLPQGVHKVALIYGPSNLFSGPGDDLENYWNTKYENKILQMSSWNKEDLQRLIYAIEAVVYKHNEAGIIDLTLFDKEYATAGKNYAKLNPTLLRNTLMSTGLPISCWRCLGLEYRASTIKCQTTYHESLEDCAQKHGLSTSDKDTCCDLCCTTECDPIDVRTALIQSRKRLIHEVSIYKKLKKENRNSRNQVDLTIDELNVILNGSTLKKIKSGKARIAIWTRSYNFHELAANKQNVGRQEKFRISVAPLKANNAYTFYLKLYYDGNILQRRTEAITSGLLNENFTNLNRYTYSHFGLELKKEDTRGSFKSNEFILFDSCKGPGIYRTYGPISSVSGLEVVGFSYDVAKTIQDSIQRYYSSLGIYNTTALVNTGLFNHHLVPSKEYSTRVKEAYGNIYRSKIDFRTQLVDDEYALFRERREILESPYYGRLMNYYSTNTLYQSIHSILRNGLLDYEKFEDIIDGRIKLDEDYTNAGGLWYITSYEFADSNIRRLRYNIDKFELLRESVMQLYVSGSNLGLNPYIPMTTHTKKTNLDNKAATLKARVTTYNKRLEALDSSNSRVNSELYKLRERLKIETDSARKASLMFSIVDQKTIRSRNNADKRRIREKIDTLYDQIAKTTDKLDVILTQIRDTQGTYEQEYKDFLYHLDVMIESLYARQALMHDVYYNLTSNDHQFDELSKLLLSGADFTSTYALAGASTNDFLTRAYYYISGDLGMTGIYLRNEVSIVRPYVGVNFNLFPINKHAHYNVFNARNWYRGTSVMIGAVLDFNSNDFDYYRNSLSTQTAFMTGVGCRLSDYIRLSAGAVWLQEKQSLNPLLSDYRLTPAPFVSLSLDVDVRKHVSSVTTRLSTSNLF